MNHRINLTLRTRIFVSLAVVALLVVAGSFFFGGGADALPADGTHIKIYDNCDDCNQIGYRHLDCWGNITTQWGVQSSSCMQSVTYGCEPN